MRLGVLTGGGDCPGLNALIRGLVKRGTHEFGYEFVGIENGYMGLVEPGLAHPLTEEDTRGILPKGGTILGTSNKANPFSYATREDGHWVERDVSDQVLLRCEELGLDGLIAVGGDGTLSIAHRLVEKGLKVVGCPKTIDNDLSGTDQTFGFDTARLIVTEALDRLHSTAEAHDRVMVVEIMGRHAGFLTLESGIAGGADVILIPEIPYSVESVVEKIRRRSTRRRSFSIIAISEGAFPQGGELAVLDTAEAIPGRGVVRLGGSGKALADLLARHIEAEIRVTVLGHLQRGGSPSAADRVLATRYGCKVLDLVSAGQWDHMVALRAGEIIAVPLSESRKERRVDPAGELVRFTKSMGISFGD
ncbi:6-phosphofructokinase I [Myxococcus xanthus DK 1622]|uniref:ATP-dependent 6-phosphofructokinase n=2 Tax=Myxococcus xanthus TaxID=34 RepID=Q1D577_MYXXD|nr:MULTISPECIES: 6-phosphofructokinase [Myxococcus]AAD47060.1 Pfk1 [Myxococcus xanthus DZF1]ABF89567.1 6-phosphofructokinase I [Myxococcus xanthus DK 1622]QPM76638.1 6-phosphofructokinase [Myxococcus xanthus]QQR41517.1 6-phosphofructokinase [Myxococcus xanthus]QVW65701.1 6-phosphofructokinase [Myxococcus xanthus DZ2]